MDYIDLYYLHRIKPYISVEEVAQATGRLITEGFFRDWGFFDFIKNWLNCC